MNENQKVEPLFTIFHFNDVYDIQPNKKGMAGIVNFEVNLRKLKQKHPKNIVLFSGDCFSPSILTNIFQGKQMVTALNKLHIDVACYGNHQFDFDPETSEKLATSCNFPWMLGNIKYKQTDFNLGNGIPFITKEFFGLKIGFFGVAGEDWLGILGDQYENQLQYIDVEQHSKKMCKHLRQNQKCDMVIAMTHMRVPQDQKLPLSVPDIDIVLGGHDHIIMRQFINGIPVLKSGDNFKTIGVIDVYKKDSKPQVHFKCKNYDFDINVRQVPVTQQDIDTSLQQYVENCMKEYNKNDSVVGYTSTDLDIRFSQIRTKQTNYGNFFADLVRAYYDSDCCVVNSGALRNDTVIKAGPLTYSIISNFINDLLVVKEVPGSILLQMLEYACSNLPNTFAGSFLLISGIKFTYDYRKHPRIQTVEVAGSPLDLERKYSVATKFYLSTGGDGFTMIRDCKYLVDQVSGIDTLRLLLRFFKGADNKLQPQKVTINEKSLQQIKKSASSQKQLMQKMQSIEKLPSIDTKLPQQNVKLTRKMSVRQSRMFNLVYQYIEGPDKTSYISINPQVDGRIVSLYP